MHSDLESQMSRPLTSKISQHQQTLPGPHTRNFFTHTSNHQTLLLHTLTDLVSGGLPEILTIPNTFSAFCLGSNVVCVLISATTDMSPTGGLKDSGFEAHLVTSPTLQKRPLCTSTGMRMAGVNNNPEHLTLVAAAHTPGPTNPTTFQDRKHYKNAPRPCVVKTGIIFQHPLCNAHHPSNVEAAGYQHWFLSNGTSELDQGEGREQHFMGFP